MIDDQRRERTTRQRALRALLLSSLACLVLSLGLSLDSDFLGSALSFDAVVLLFYLGMAGLLLSSGLLLRGGRGLRKASSISLLLIGGFFLYMSAMAAFRTARALQVGVPQQTPQERAAAKPVGQLPALMLEWKSHTGPIVREYLDPQVPREQWLETAGYHLPLLRALLMRMEATVSALEDQKVRTTVAEPVVDLYRRRLEALTALQFAIERGDPAQVEAALKLMTEATETSRSLQRRLIDLARSSGVDQSTIEASLRDAAEASIAALE